jgi:NACHT domain
MIVSSTGSVLDWLKPHAAFNAEYNSRERRDDQHASICKPGTRERVITHVLEWAVDTNARPICWIYGPAGTGKSSVATSIAEQCIANKCVVLTFFFSRGRVDRTSLTKVFTTLAYQLAASKGFPPARQSIQQVIKEDPRVLTANFETQLQLLVVEPIMAGSLHSMPQIIIIIDGLDECESHAYQTQLIELLMDTAPALFPFARVLLTSRPEEQISNKFHAPAAHNITHHIGLHDYDVVDDIREVCRSGFAEIVARDYMQHYLPNPWPSDTEIEQVVGKSEGIFIYISTLLRFVDEGDDLPQNKLQVALDAHAGLDSIYCQVLASARGANKQLVISAIILLQQTLSINDLGEFLNLTPAQVRFALHGTRSILNIPQSNDQGVVPYHASISDFVQDGARSSGYFRTLEEQHGIIMQKCVQVITAGMEHPGSVGRQSTAMVYAFQHWCYHLASSLASPGGQESIATQVQLLEIFLAKIEQHWLRQWLYSLNGLNRQKGVHLVVANRDWLEEIYSKFKVHILHIQ